MADKDNKPNTKTTRTKLKLPKDESVSVDGREWEREMSDEYFDSTPLHMFLWRQWFYFRITEVRIFLPYLNNFLTSNIWLSKVKKNLNSRYQASVASINGGSGSESETPVVHATVWQER